MPVTDPPRKRKLHWGWYALAGIIISTAGTLSALLILDYGVKKFGVKVNLNTYRGIDDMLQFVDEPLFAPGKDGWFQTTPYAERSMVRSRFRAQKGNAWRVFVLGESFAMGTPYTMQGPAGRRQGGIPDFLAADLAAMAPGRNIEVLNAAAGAQDSHRVRRIAEQVLEFSPDLVFAAVCNNEGAPPPGLTAETLHRFALVRLIRRLFIPAVKPGDRSFYTPQDQDFSAVRRAYKENIYAILKRAEEKKVRVLIATLPVNLRYSGKNLGALADITPPHKPQPCLNEGLALLGQKRTPEARAALSACGDVEAVRTLGLLEYSLGSYKEAHRLLTQYTELVPRNRCRASYNAIVREAAAAFPGARLVDLEREAEALSPHGIPGEELFLDYCHMNWKGYKAMEDAILKSLASAGWLPGKGGKPLTREALRRRFRIAPDQETEPPPPLP
ncbi:MAG TPA: SGNH/GDSL hydrolase family protein [Elusimicrobiales bacterium]|nr:SGNH/GDSL hydrolase family protein [Elusimicrobiales bacterium]